MDLDKIRELNKKDKMRSAATYQKKQEIRRQNEAYFKQQSDWTRTDKETFLDNGHHKVKSAVGRSVFEALAKLRSREERGVYLKNTAFRDGLVFEVDHGRVIDAGISKVVMPSQDATDHGDRFGPPKARAVVSSGLLFKLSQAVRGGTDEKLEALANKGNGGNEDDESESDEDMFEGAKRSKADLSSIQPGLAGSAGEGRAAGINRLRQEMDIEVEQSEKERSKLKDEMQEYRKAQKEAGELDEHYMECFPTYNEDDFQFSVRDNLSKRPPNMGKSFSHRRPSGKGKGDHDRKPPHKDKAT